MKLLLNILLLLCVRSSGSVSSESLVVTQSLHVCFQEGETGNISCCWDGAAERVGVKWLKNQTLIENKIVINQSTGSKNGQKNKCSNLTIENMTKTHSGKYICQVTVEIPVLSDFEGQGTTVTVTPRENTTNTAGENPCASQHQHQVFPFLLKGLLILSLSIILAVVCVDRSAREAQRSLTVSAPAENNDVSLQSREEAQREEDRKKREMDGKEMTQEERVNHSTYLPGVLGNNC